MSIQFKRSGTTGKVPLITDIKVGEIAINVTDKKIYTNNGTSIVTLGGSDGPSGLPLSGGTLTGPLTLSGAPTSNLHASSKAYVDGKPTIITKPSAPVLADGKPGDLFVEFTAAVPAGQINLPRPFNATRSAMSSSGNRVILLASGQNALMISEDNGNTWFESALPATSAGDYRWYSIHLTKDGMTGVIGGYGTHILLTVDGGRTWTTKTIPWAHSAGAIHISEDGQKIVYSSVSGAGWSHDSGTTWAWNGFSFGYYNGLSLSRDGMVGFTTQQNSERHAYYTIDGGQTWTYSPLAYNGTWGDTVFGSDDGLVGYTFSSSSSHSAGMKTINGGRTWAYTGLPAAAAMGGACSADGVYAVVLRNNSNDAYYSSDSGTTWQRAALTSNSYWRTVVMTADGKRCLATHTSATTVSSSVDSGKTWSLTGVSSPAKLKQIYARGETTWEAARPKMSRITDITAPPTAEQFNALLAELRNNGYME